MPDFKNEILHKLKIIDDEVYQFNNAPEDIRNDVVKALQAKEDLNLYRDVTNASIIANKFNDKLDEIFAKVQPITSVQNYAPAGSTIRRLFPGPFAPFSYVADNYWAAFKARREIRVDIARDGYVLETPPGYPKRKIKIINQILDDFEINHFRMNAVDFLNVFGNVFIDKITTDFGGNKKGLRGFNFLLPKDIIPTVDYLTNRVNGWDYWEGVQKVHFELGEIDHLKTFSLQSLDLGIPSLASVLVDIEGAMYSSLYNTTMFKKGGLIRAIVAMEKLKETDAINDKTYFNFIRKVQEWFERLYGGLRGSGNVVFTPNVTGVYPLVNPKDLEGSYNLTSERVAIMTCEVLGCPPERIGILRGSQYINKDQTADSLSLSFDNNYYYLLGIVDDYINKVLIREGLGEDQVFVRTSGEFGALSKVQAEFGKLIAECGANSVKVDEFRTKVLHWEPLGPPYGDKFLGELLNAPKDSPSKSKGEEILRGCNEFTSKAYETHYPKFIRYY